MKMLTYPICMNHIFFSLFFMIVGYIISNGPYVMADNVDKKNRESDKRIL